jgi:hypothetical protein
MAYVDESKNKGEAVEAENLEYGSNKEEMNISLANC